MRHAVTVFDESLNLLVRLWFQQLLHVNSTACLETIHYSWLNHFGWLFE
jgi:hypothetical protein